MLNRSLIENILTSGHHFKEHEILQYFQFRMLNAAMLLITVFALLFAVLSDLGINDLGSAHSIIDYFYSASSLLLLIWLRHNKSFFNTSVNILLSISLLTFTSALILVIHDEFRIIWFYLLIFVAYITGSTKKGVFFTILSIFDIIFCYLIFDLGFSDVALTSALLGLVIGSLLAFVYTEQVKAFNKQISIKNRVLKTLASQDQLTGIMNRREFLSTGQKYFHTAKRQKKSIAYLMLDIDHFKKINDTYGHSAGDNILIRFAESISKTLRTNDLFGRIGGEEFGIILYDTDIYHAKLVAEKIRKTINGQVFHNDENPLRITTSIGIALLEEDDQHLVVLQNRADEALYFAKESGRNRTIFLSPFDNMKMEPNYSI